MRAENNKQLEASMLTNQGFKIHLGFHIIDEVLE